MEALEAEDFFPRLLLQVGMFGEEVAAEGEGRGVVVVSREEEDHGLRHDRYVVESLGERETEINKNDCGKGYGDGDDGVVTMVVREMGMVMVMTGVLTMVVREWMGMVMTRELAMVVRGMGMVM